VDKDGNSLSESDVWGCPSEELFDEQLLTQVCVLVGERVCRTALGTHQARWADCSWRVPPTRPTPTMPPLQVPLKLPPSLLDIFWGFDCMAPAGLAPRMYAWLKVTGGSGCQRAAGGREGLACAPPSTWPLGLVPNAVVALAAADPSQGLARPDAHARARWQCRVSRGRGGLCHARAQVGVGCGWSVSYVGWGVHHQSVRRLLCRQPGLTGPEPWMQWRTRTA
jgi:hypothetical protein